MVHQQIKGTINGNHRGTDQSKISPKKPQELLVKMILKRRPPPLMQPGATVLLPAQDLIAIPTRPQREPPCIARPPRRASVPATSARPDSWQPRRPSRIPTKPAAPSWRATLTSETASAASRTASGHPRISSPAGIPAERSRVRARPEHGGDPARGKDPAS